MLSQIHIRNFALIDDLSIEPGRGFNVLTGETGAGKSIIIDAITTVLGERLSGDLVRTGAQRAVVEAVFDLTDDLEARNRAEELGLDVEEGMLVISRELTAQGKSQGRVNGRITTIGMLRELTSGLIDVHGQHEHQSLLSVDVHLDILDRWCGQDALDLREEVETLYGRLRELTSELDQLRRDERERTRLLDLFQFQKSEIEAARLAPGENEELLAERNRLANAEKLCELAAQAYSAISGAGGEGGAVDSLSAALAQLQSMAAVDESLEPVVQDLQTALYSAEQAQSAIRAYREDIEFNPARLEAVEDRLDLIRTLKRKYGDSIEQIISYGREVVDKMDGLTHSEERASELEKEIEQVRIELMDAARRLSEKRKAGAAEFARAVEAQLSDLAMSETRFEVAFAECEPTGRGTDEVEFVISPNPGEPLKPLVKIASGGEMSRVMLALKTVMSGADRVPTLIFDEIDAGIGGRTAQVLGLKLAAVSRSAQVLCVTHLPQIASCADHHFTVEKGIEGDRTAVSVRRAEGEARVEELARMLGGVEDSDTAAVHAREMLEAGRAAGGVSHGP